MFNILKSYMSSITFTIFTRNTEKIEKVEKLVANLHDNKRIYYSYKELKQALNYGLILKSFIESLSLIKNLG